MIQEPRRLVSSPSEGSTLECPSVVKADEYFTVMLSLGRNILNVRRIWLNFLPKGDRSPRKLCELILDRKTTIKKSPGVYVDRSKDAFVIEMRLQASGTLRAIFLNDNRELWDLSGELLIAS